MKEKELFSKFLTDEGKDVNKKSPEFLAFLQMQDRIEQNVKLSQGDICKHKMEFAGELTKLATSADNSPWFIVPPDGHATVGEDNKNDETPDPKALWDGFDDDFDSVPNIEITRQAQRLNASSSPSPNPVPPFNSRCASSEQLADLATANGEADLLGLNIGESDVEQTDSGLVSGMCGRGTLNMDILSLSRNPVESNKSSGRSSPSQLEADMAALGIIAETTDAPETGGGLVDDFLGLTFGDISSEKAVTSAADAFDILGFDDKSHQTSHQEKQPTLMSNDGNLFGGTAPTGPPLVVGQFLCANDSASAFTSSVSNDDIFGLGRKKETAITSVKSGENLFSFGEEETLDMEKSEACPASDADRTPLYDEFDPRAAFDNLDAKPIADDTADIWGSAAVKPRNPFASATVGDQSATIPSSVNPFSAKNPFLSSDADNVAEIPFADDSNTTGMFDEFDGEPSIEVTGFNPFATITDDSAGDPESTFDPFQTIHDDDAFEVNFPDSTETTEDDSKTRFNPFNKDPPLPEKFANFKPLVAEEASHSTTEYSTEEEDENAEPFLPYHPQFTGDGWTMLLRQPTKKKLTQNRYWKEVYVKLTTQNETPVIRVYKDSECKECLQELGVQYSYTLCNLGLQQFDQYSKCHTVKIQYVFYRERVGVKVCTSNCQIMMLVFIYFLLYLYIIFYY